MSGGGARKRKRPDQQIGQRPPAAALFDYLIKRLDGLNPEQCIQLDQGISRDRDLGAAGQRG